MLDRGSIFWVVAAWVSVGGNDAVPIYWKKGVVAIRRPFRVELWSEGFRCPIRSQNV